MTRHVKEGSKHRIILEGLESLSALWLMPFEFTGIVGADPCHPLHMLLTHADLVLGDGLERPRQTQEGSGWLTTLSLPQIGQDLLECLELDEAGEGRHDLDRSTGEDQSRCGLEHLMPKELQGRGTERPD